MASDADPAEELRDVQRQWEAITDVPETPHSMMAIIEHGLGSQRRAEVYVNRLLRYFLDPTEPHGMDTEFLLAFLEAIPEACNFQEDTFDGGDIRVDDQVQIRAVEDGTDDPGSGSRGFVDLVLEVPNDWFLLIELKFSAAETGTEFYYEATHVGERQKGSYESNEYYLYMHQADRPEATEERFANWSWAAFVDEFLTEFIEENAPRYPQRTVTQLREFADDIREVAGMTQEQENTREKVELYLRHYDAITDLSSTFDSQWESFTGEWGSRLASALESDGVTGTYDFGDDNVAVELDSASGADSRWLFRSASSDWGMIFRDGWWRHTDDLEGAIYGRPDDRNDVRIGFHHRLGRNRELAVGDRTLRVYFRNMGANDQSFIDRFRQQFYERDIRNALPDAATMTGNRRDLIEASYDINMEADDDIFEAYVGALRKAFVDLVVENDKLISEIDRAFYDSVNREYGVSIGPSE